MTNTRKRVAAIAAAIVMSVAMVSGTCFSASAATGTVDAGNGYATLTNTSGTSRYGVVSLQVVNSSTGSVVKRVGNEKNLSNYSSVTASASGYSSTTYRFKASGTLYNGTNVQSGAYWSGSDTY